MKKVFSIVNFLIVVSVIFWNYWVNTGSINDRTVADVSEQYNSLFTPAGYAFSIWGLIFLGLLVLSINQLIMAFRGSRNSDSILKIGPWLSIANVANAAWLWFWLHEQVGVSVIVMLVILFSLIQIIWRNNMERWDAPLSVILTLWWPICLYSGWIAVACIANVAAWLSSLGWSAILSEVQWTFVMIGVAGVLNVWMVYKRNMREFAAVGVWALVAISIRHWGHISILQYTALLWAVIVLIVIGIHGYKNRRTSPLMKYFGQSE